MANQKDLINAYELHRMDIISRLVAYHGIDIHDAEDSLQDIVLRALEKWGDCSNTLEHWVPADLPHFLFKATRDRCKDIYRRDHRRTQIEELYFGNTC